MPCGGLNRRLKIDLKPLPAYARQQMTQLFVSFSMAAAMTAVFAFRFQTWRRPWLLVAYFVFFFVAEWSCEAMFLPPDALGVEVGVLCLVLAVIFVGVTWVSQRMGGFE